MMDHSVLDSRYSWSRLGLSLLIACVGNVGMWAIIVMMPSMQADFGVARGAASLPYTATMLGFALGNFLIGRVVDRFGITVALWGAAFAVAAGFVGSAFAPNIELVTALQFLAGLGTAASFGPLIADISQWFLKRRGIAVAIAACGNYLSGTIWPMALKGMISTGDWRDAYLALAVIVLVTVLPLSLLLRRRVPLAAQAHADAVSAARVRTSGFTPTQLTWLLGIAGIACCVAMSMPQVHIVAYCADLGFGPAVGAEMLSVMLFGGVISRLVSGLLADRLGGVTTLLIGSTLQTIGLMLYLPFDGLVPLYVVSAIFGLSQGGIVPSYAVIVREYLPAREAGARVGFVMMATILGMALGGWMSGWIYDQTGSYLWAFLNGIGWNVLNIGIVVLLIYRARTARRPAMA
ncbi:MAG TPA: MFS transporter [Rhodobacteraceae bacterium]|nr:MFS transporter [Paracoccaceae bacterium]HBV56196.1 MFS transporter [Paracoccaceae bacterium]